MDEENFASFSPKGKGNKGKGNGKKEPKSPGQSQEQGQGLPLPSEDLGTLGAPMGLEEILKALMGMADQGPKVENPFAAPGKHNRVISPEEADKVMGDLHRNCGVREATGKHDCSFREWARATEYDFAFDPYVQRHVKRSIMELCGMLEIHPAQMPNDQLQAFAVELATLLDLGVMLGIAIARTGRDFDPGAYKGEEQEGGEQGEKAA